MKHSKWIRILSLICVFALMAGMVSTSALAAPAMRDTDVREVPVMDGVDGPQAIDVAERPASLVDVRRTSTNESLAADLLAADCCSAASPHPETGTIDMSGDTEAASEHWILFEGKNTSGKKLTLVSNNTKQSDWSASGTGITYGGKTSLNSCKAAKVSVTGVGDAVVKSSAYTFTLHVVDSAAPSCEHTATTAHDEVPASCNATGTKEYWTCDDCGKNFSDVDCTVEVTDLSTLTLVKDPAVHLDENVEYVEEVPATCAKAGVAEYYLCKGCNKKFSDSTCETETNDTELTLPATGEHDFDPDTGKCIECGYQQPNEHECEFTVEKMVIKAATCEEDGSKVMGCNYPGCDATETVVIDALGHDPKTVPAVAANCTEAGSNAYEVCQRAGCKYTTYDDATTPIAALGHDFQDGVCSRCGKKEAKFLAAAGWLESAYALWPIAPGVSSYTAYVAPEGGAYTKLDNELIREYPGYMRVDALGLKAGRYTLKVVPNVGDAMETEPLTVEAHDRSGYAFVNATTTPGAYNADGTLKSNAKVIYVTEQTKDSVTVEGVTGSDGKTQPVGLSAIVLAYKKSNNSNPPIDIRIIGNISDPGGMPKGDLYVDNSQKCAGMTIEGVGNDAVANGWGIVLKGAQYVEIRNLGFMNCDSGEGDSIGLQQNNDHCWVHNNDIFYGQAGSDSDQQKGDGSLDTKKSTYVTHSYNHFWDGGKVNLQGANGSDTSNYITYHHNWYDHCDSRMPRVRVATVHVYNNYYDGIAKYGVGATTDSDVFVENNYFRNVKEPMIISKQGSEGGAVLSGETGGMIKAFGNVFVGSSKFVPYHEDNTNFDCYVAKTRDEKVPADVKALSGGATYNNFDTASDFYKYPVHTAEEAMLDVTKYSGRVGGGDFKWEFDDATEDENYDVIPELKSALMSYKTSLVSVGGTVTNTTPVEHVHRPGTWITTKTPGCDAATHKVVDGQETQYCVDCGAEVATRKVPGAHSNDGQGVCTVCGEKVANSGGPSANPNAKILKATDFKDLAKNDAITQAMLDAKYEGYFKSSGTGMKAGISSSKAGATVDHLSLPNTGNGGVSFTVTNGPAEVTVKASSTGKGKTSTMLLKDASGTAVADKTNGQTNITLKENVSAATTVKYTLPAGTYTVCSIVDTTGNGVRLIQLSVTEAENTCTHTAATHTAAKDATCTEAGNIEYWTCPDCNTMFSDAACTKTVTDVSVPAKQHSWGAWQKVDATNHKRVCANDAAHVETAAHTEATRVKGESNATCTKPGSFTEETYCTVCNAVLKTEEKNGVLAPHKATATAAKAATCVAEGNIAYWTCEVCSKTFSDAACTAEVTQVTTAKDPTNHVGGTEVQGAKSATSTEDGYTGDTCCKSCHAVLTKGSVIPAITGPMSKLLKGSDQDTCEEIKTQKKNGKDVSQKGWATDSTAYKMGGNDKHPNFFTVHYSANAKVDTTEKTWNFKGNYYSTGEKVKESRFSFGGKAQPSKSLKNTIEFTTTKPSTVKVWWVQAGGNAVAADGTVTAGTPRQIGIWKSTDTKNVLKTSASKANKNDAEFTTFDLTAPGTYYLGGVETNYFFMVEVIEEGDIARTWAESAPPVDPSCKHTSKTHTAAVPAQCEKAGNIEYWTCSDCGKTFSDETCATEVTTVAVAAKGHDMKETAAAVPATCKAEGKTAVLTCANGCGKTEGGVSTAKLPHTEATRTKNITGATCTVPGSYDLETYCSVCDQVLKTEHKDGVTLPHAPGQAVRENEVKATCTAAGGYDEVTKCELCGQELTRVHKTTAALGHDLQEVPGTAVAPTESQEGKEADKKCSRCDYVETGAKLPALKPGEVNKQALADAIAKAKADQRTAIASVDGKDVAKTAKWVTAEEMKTLADAITAAEGVEKKADATQSEVDDAVTALNAAVATFDAAKKNGLKETSSRPKRSSRHDRGETIDDPEVPLAGGPELNTKDHTAYITGYPDGTVGAERNITRQETAAIFYRLLTEQSKSIYGTDENSFPDIDASHWANRDISTLSKAGIIKGLPDGTFGATRNITRAEFVTMAVRFYTVNAGAENPFPDVEGHWAEKEILFAYSKGWVKGLPGGVFGPDKPITRAEAMRIINNILERSVDATGVAQGTTQFSDVSDSAWYYYDVVEATNSHNYTRQSEGAALERWTELLGK